MTADMGWCKAARAWFHKSYDIRGYASWVVPEQSGRRITGCPAPCSVRVASVDWQDHLPNRSQHPSATMGEGSLERGVEFTNGSYTDGHACMAQFFRPVDSHDEKAYEGGYRRC